MLIKLQFGTKNSTKIKAEYKQSGNQRLKNHHAKCRNHPHCVTKSLNSPEYILFWFSVLFKRYALEFLL